MHIKQIQCKGSTIKVVFDDGSTKKHHYRQPSKADNAKPAIEHLMTLEEPPTLAEFVKCWEQWHRDPELDPDSHKQYDFALDHKILPKLGECRIDHITADVILRFAEAMRKDRLWESTVVNTIRILSAVLGVAKSWFYISKNPMDDISIGSVGKRRNKPPKPKGPGPYDENEADDSDVDSAA